ncbi:unnamed protein product [Pylaiella littoralis]
MASAIDIAELIARPLDVIARLRVELKARGNSNNSGEQESAFLAAAISEALCSGASPALDEVPVLCRHSLAEGKLAANSLVRYRGMVQDQYEPEYFVGSFEEIETATGKRARKHVKYVDSIAQRPGFVNEYDGPGAMTMDRLPLYCVPVPGQSQWTMPSKQGQQQQHQGDKGGGVAVASGGLPKRHREQPGGEDAMDCTDEHGDAKATPSDSGNGGPQPKAPRAAPDLPKSGEDAGAAPASGDGSNGVSSSNGVSNGPGSAFHHGQELELAGLACVVKVYDFREGQVKLNDTAEFIGVLGYDQALVASQEEGDVPMGEEAAGQQQQQQVPPTTGNPFQGLENFSRKIPPPSLAPRLHCVFHRKLPACEPLPVDPKQPQDALRTLQGPMPFGEFMRDAKGKAIEHLKKGLRGDALAAEYALLALLSKAYVRTESFAPGSLSLNLRGVSADEAPGFHAAVSDLVPKCVAVPITTKSLSEKFKFSPKKDYEADRLMMSSLQLSDGTVVVLDETALEPGEVGTEGTGNLAALDSLVSLQKVPYDFGFYKMDFEVDHPTISLSLRGSVVPCGAVVPVVAAAGSASGAIPTVSSKEKEEENEEEKGEGAALLLERLRVYVQATRRTELSLDEASSALAEEDFVKARQQRQAITGEDFHRMLTIARLTALSLGDGTMTAEHWSHMKNLEASVSGRIQQEQATRATNGSRSAVVVPAAANSAVGATPIPPSSQAGPLNAIPEND